MLAAMTLSSVSFESFVISGRKSPSPVPPATRAKKTAPIDSMHARSGLTHRRSRTRFTMNAQRSHIVGSPGRLHAVIGGSGRLQGSTCVITPQQLVAWDAQR